MIHVIVVSLIGLILSIYAYHVEKKAENKNYNALCDINDKISCTKVFKSKYGKLSGISNSVIGIFFYIFIIILYYVKFGWIFYFALLTVFGSVYLAYLQFFKVRSYCLVCSSIYIVNILLLIFSYY